MTNTIRNHPLTSFYIITFIMSFILLMGHFILPDVGYYSLSFTQFAPGIAVLVLAYFYSIKTSFHFSAPTIKHGFLALAIPSVLVMISAYLMFLLGFDFVPWKGDGLFYALSFIAIFMGCIAEEIGWRGFLLKCLQIKSSAFKSSLIVGLLWGIWHLNFTGGLMGFILYTITIIEMSICMTWLYNRTEGNLVLMSIWHIAFNLTSHIFLWERFNLQLFMVESVVFGLLSIFLLIYDRKTFFRKPMIEAFK